MKINEITNKKINNKPLTKEEISYVVDGFVFKKTINDQEMTLWLKAIKDKGMTEEELIYYSESLISSGDVLPLVEMVDKHSTGGIGDKVSIILLPIIMAMDLNILKMSGRGLGFTGGTIDKFESLSGFNTELSIEAAKKQTNKIGGAITGQTPNLTPADGAIYALRDVTNTVDSKPLIAASIMSKKIATGAKYILIDLKVGSGAFVKNLDEAKELGEMMKLIGKAHKREVFILMTSMDRPLGNSIGNAVEIKEAVGFLKNFSKDQDTYDLIKKIATELYKKAKSTTNEVACELFDKVINNGKAFNKLKELVNEQGGNSEELDDLSYFEPKYRTIVKSNADGYVDFKDVSSFGSELLKFKAGRLNKNDEIYHSSGIKIFSNKGDKIEKYNPLYILYSENKPSKDDLENIREIFTISKEKPNKENIILGEITW